MDFLERPLRSCSAHAQYTKGMLLYIYRCGSGAREDYLVAARLIRAVAMQNLVEAQFELGEQFRLGLLCDGHNMMRFARRYIRRASKRGHLQAIARMRELRSCVLCGADDGQWACGYCRQARYCDYDACCVKHWREGGGVGGGLIAGPDGAGARHKDICSRTYAAAATDSDTDDDESDDEDV